VSPDKLAAYVGDYEGGRNVSVRGGTLYYRTNANAMPEAAVALSDSTFALSTLARLHFERGADGTMRIRAALPDGGTSVFGRVSTTR
jgi:predicted HAD superfamily phosphohydrolase